MTRLFHKTFLSLIGAVLCVGGVRAQQLQVESRIAGLENNEEYMSLMREDAQLQIREDSIVNAVNLARQQLRDNPTSRQQLSQTILELENRIFEVRNAKGRLIDRINTIEQDWVLANLNGAVQTPEAPTAVEIPVASDAKKVRNLIANSCFSDELSAEDYAALQRAQRLEISAVDYVNRYFSNYGAVRELAEAYAQAGTETEATDIYERYTALQGLNRVLADSLAVTWNYIFDNKSYAYGYLLDKYRQDEILSLEEERLSDAARQLATLRGKTTSDEIADYFLRKKVLVDYEKSVAGVFGLDAARDSLQNIAAQLESADFGQPRIDVEERLFLDYDSVTFSSVPKYNYQHPIPECRVYEKGTIYRILIGSYNTKRAVSTFRGAYPIGYLVDEDNRWNYYAGGFATREDAETAQKQLKAHGFLRPEIVVWTDGVLRNPSQDAAAVAVYRVEITGTEALSDAVKQAIADTAEGSELSRVGQQLFVVGSFDDKAVADRVAAAVRQIDTTLEIKVTETAE